MGTGKVIRSRVTLVIQFTKALEEKVIAK